MNFIYNTKSDFLLKIDEYGENKLFSEVEMPLAYVLTDMELTGIRVDKNYLLANIVCDIRLPFEEGIFPSADFLPFAEHCGHFAFAH